MATVITHVWNEEFLLPFWLRHHVPVFDHGIIIDYASTDRTVAICHELAPTWEVRQSRNPDFNAAECDVEVMETEREIEGWKIALTTTEFLHGINLAQLTEAIDCSGHNGAQVRPVAMVDMAEHANLTDDPLTEQCHTGFFGGYMEPYKARVIHRHPDGAYSPGRHGTGHGDLIHYPDGALILWYGFAPWTSETRQRKLQIQNRIPQADKNAGYGGHHLMDETQLHASWQAMVGQSGDLRQVPEYASVIG